MNNFCRMCGGQIGGGILYCLVCVPKAAAHIEIESLQADNAALRQQVKELEGENERLRDAGWHLYHCLYGELSGPAFDIFMPSQKFKEAVLENWKLAVKTLKSRKENKMEEKSEGCTCHGCGRKYNVDLLLPDEIWEQISPPKSRRL